MKIWCVPNTPIRYAIHPELGPMCSYDKGKEWHFTFRGLDEFRRMWPQLESFNDSNEDNEREIFGETLDEEIPEDMWEMIQAI